MQKKITSLFLTFCLSIPVIRAAGQEESISWSWAYVITVYEESAGKLTSERTLYSAWVHENAKIDDVVDRSAQVDDGSRIALKMKVGSGSTVRAFRAIWTDIDFGYFLYTDTPARKKQMTIHYPEEFELSSEPYA